MNIYEVSYEGFWMGGVAIVLADSEEEALILCEEQEGKKIFDFKHAKIRLLNSKKGVIYVDNGEY